MVFLHNMIHVTKHGVLLEATKNQFEDQAVLNPTCYQNGNTVHMYYRAVRQGNYSSIGYARLDGPLTVAERDSEPLLSPKFSYEKHGIEDPRIVFLDGIYYLFYTAYDGRNARSAYATSKDGKKFTRRGVLSPSITYDRAEDVFRQSKLMDRYYFFESYFKDKVGADVLLWEKDACLFPEKIGGKFALLHRVLPGMQIIYFDDFTELTSDYWERYLERLGDTIVLDPKHGFESRNIGCGAAPIRTEKGWLLIYHAVEDARVGRIYYATAALLDLANPQKVLGRLSEPLFSPVESYEKNGDVANVVFPEGTALFDGRLYIYYGAADSRIAVASVNLQELLSELISK
ncbi:MAG: pesticidal protein Cry7Aa [bacterium]|nr:pesticidal protein Cry7Aa [bacterium]